MKNITLYDATFPDLANEFGPPVERPSDIERTLANLSRPDGSALIVFWFDPRAERFQGTEAVIDRASGAMIPAYLGADPSFPGSWSHSNAINGTATLTASRAWFGPFAYTLENQPTAFPANEYTFLATVRPRAPVGTATNTSVLGHVGPVVNGIYGPSLGFVSTGRMIAFDGPNVQTRLTEPSVNNFDTNLIAGVTFSTTRGIALHRNGAEIIRNADDLNPTTHFDLRFLGHVLQDSGSFEGDVGICMLIAGDLSDPAYAAAKQTIMGYLSDMSGIALEG